MLKSRSGLLLLENGDDLGELVQDSPVLVGCKRVHIILGVLLDELVDLLDCGELLDEGLRLLQGPNEGGSVAHTILWLQRGVVRQIEGGEGQVSNAQDHPDVDEELDDSARTVEGDVGE